MKIILVIFLVSITSAVYSQELISSLGNSYSNATSSISYSIGEVFITGNESGYNEGFHQPEIRIITSLKKEIFGDIQLYPNPAKNSITFSPFQTSLKYSIMVISSQGDQLANFENIKQKIQIDLSPYKAGLYIFQISNGEENQSLKVIKQ